MLFWNALVLPEGNRSDSNNEGETYGRIKPGFQGRGVYSQPRVSSSLIEKQIIMPSQKKAPAIMILVSPGLYFTCMKKRITKSILVTAMTSAATVFQRPRSM